MVRNNKAHIGEAAATVNRKPMPAGWCDGYADAYHGLPYRPDYQTWKEKQQRNYENGRLIAVNIKAAGHSIRPTFKTSSPTFIAAYHATKEKIGIAHDVSSIMANERFDETVTVY